MKKIFKMLTAIIIFSGIFFSGCEKNKLIKNDSYNNSAFSKKEIIELHKVFNFVSIN